MKLNLLKHNNLMLRVCDAISDLILRSTLLRASRRMAASAVAAWFETHGVAVLLTSGPGTSCPGSEQRERLEAWATSDSPVSHN
jgi:hypothetical protein